MHKIAIAFAAVCALAPSVLAAQEWACVQHDPQHTGRTDRVVPDARPFMKWEADVVGSVFGSPLISDQDMIVVSTGNNSEVRSLFAYGVEDWAFPTVSPVIGAPALASDGQVYVGDMKGYVYKIRTTGVQNWRYRNSTNELTEHRFITHATPGIGGGVFVADWSNWLRKVSGGSQVFSVDLREYGHAPASVSSDGNWVYYPTHYGSSTRFRVLCRSASSGTGGWTSSDYPLGSSSAGPQASGICLDEATGRLFVSADFHASQGSFLYCLRTSDGGEVWANPINLGVGSNSIPALSQDGSTIYVTLMDGTLKAFNASNGSQLWTYDSGAETIMGSAIVDGDGRILFGDLSGVLHCVDSTGNVVWTYDEFDDTIAAAPAVLDNGDIIIGTTNGKVRRLTRSPLVIPYVAGGSTPDGVMNAGEWAGALKISVNGLRPSVNPGWSAIDPNPIDPADSSFDLYVMHDGANLYVAFDVTDNDLSSDDHPTVEHTSVWEDDCTEVYIDGDFDRDYSEGTTGGPADDDQWPEGVSPHFGINNAWWDKNTGTYNNSWWAHTVTNANGFVVEYKIAFSGIDTEDGEAGYTALRPGDIIGFNALHNDDDWGGAREHQLCLFGGDHTGAIYRTQHDWGVAILEAPSSSDVVNWRAY